MKHYIQFWILFFVLSGISACNPQPEANSLLTHAQKVIEDHPDSAMQLIDSIFYPEKSLSHKRYMEFLVTQVQAKHKTYRPVAEDTLIFVARDYFEKKNKDPDQTALAYFYSGCVYREQQHNNQAMQHYKKAEQLASQTDNANLMGLTEYNMGDLLAEQRQYGEALKLYMDAAQLYEEQPDKQAQCLSATGRMYLLLKQPDSAFYYFHKGLKTAKSTGDNKLQSLLAQNLSVAYADAKQYSQAEKYLLYAYQLNEDSTELSRYYLNFAKIYDTMGLTDSATLYTDKLIERLYLTNENAFKLSAYHYLSSQERKKGNYLSALDYKEKYEAILIDILNKNKEQSVYEISKKYDFQYIQNIYNRKWLLYQKWFMFFLILILFGGTIFTIYTINKKNKYEETQHRLNTLHLMNMELETRVQKNKERLHLAMLQQLDVAKKVLVLNEEFKKGDNTRKSAELFINSINRVLYGSIDTEEQWNAIFGALKKIRPKLPDILQEQFPSLNEQEFRICLLTYAGFSISEIALIMNLKPNTIQTRRTSIRRKIGVKSNESTIEFLNKKLD